MWIMTIVTTHQSFVDRVVAATIELGALLQVAGQTEILIPQFIRHRGLAGVNGMTGDTGQIRRLMLTGRPVHGFPGLMTVQTHLVLYLHVAGGKSAAAHEYHRRFLQGADVVGTGPMAALAGPIRKGRAGDIAISMSRLQNGRDNRIIVTGQAGLGPLRRIVGILLRSAGCRLGINRPWQQRLRIQPKCRHLHAQQRASNNDQIAKIHYPAPEFTPTISPSLLSFPSLLSPACFHQPPPAFASHTA